VVGYCSSLVFSVIARIELERFKMYEEEVVSDTFLLSVLKKSGGGKMRKIGNG